MKDNIDDPGNGEVLRIKIDGKKLLLIVAVAVVILGGVALRMHTLSDSRYPYILDGLLEGSYGGSIAETGMLAPEAGSSFDKTHTVSTPVFDVLIAAASLFQGEQTLFLLQKLIAPFAAFLLIGVYVLAKKLTTNVRASLIALMAVSAYGPFVIVTQAAWKECVGICVLPFFFLSFMMRRDPKMRALSTLLLLMMPFVHHLVALIAVLAVATFSAAGMVRARRKRSVDRVALTDVFVAVTAIVSMTAYYVLVSFDRLEYLTPENGLYLFLGVALLTSMGVYLMADRGMSKFGRVAMVTTMSAGLLLLLALNIVSPMGTVGTDALWALSLPTIAVVALAILGVFGISVWASTAGETKLIYLSMMSAPFVIVIYALLRANDLLSLTMITRTIDLFDIGLMIALGTFVAFVLKERRPRTATAAVSAVCAVLLLTVPFALDSERYAGTRNDIFTYEVDAINWTVDMTPDGKIDTDEHFAYVGVLYNREMEQNLVKRFNGVFAFQSDMIMIASERWVTVGVKDLPYGWMQLNGTEFDLRISGLNLLYLGGPPGAQIMVLTVAP